ncbi:uncharacterized protein LOC144152840 isoform X3 [Haemaphysalis longicornis]
MKLWFCRKRNNLQLQQNVPPLAMARRDGFRALSLRRKDGGAARGVPSAAAGDRKNLKTKYGGVARGVPSAASGDRKNLKTKVRHAMLLQTDHGIVNDVFFFFFFAWSWWR